MANVPILTSSADFASTTLAGSAALLMPTGVVLPFAGLSAPSGWLACDGTAISRTTYATLFAAISTSYGVGDGSTTFNLPDLRGRFPRFNDSMFGGSAAGRDSGRALGSAQGQATAKNGLTATASSSSISGTANTGVNLSHTHPSYNYFAGGGNRVDPGSFCQGSNFYSSAITTQFNTGFNGGTLDHSHSVSGTANAQSITVGAGDAETRPINLAVNAIIKT